MIVVRILWALLAAFAYQLATNVFLQAGLLLLNGHWRIAAFELLAWFAVNALAVLTATARISKLTGAPIITARDWLFILGNEQDGYYPQRAVAAHPKWPLWLVGLVECAWRNRLRNLCFWKPLAWLHAPPAPDLKSLGGWLGAYGELSIAMHWCGWRTELQWSYAPRRWFGDIGPRLDQPAVWGAISWAFRPVGKY